MKTYIADIIPKIQRYSQRLDDLTKLTNQHWVSLGDITQTKKVFIFRANKQLLISDNGIVEIGAWDYLGNQSLLLETKKENYLLKHGFFDENVIALKLDSTDSYAFFVNETKYHRELNNIEDVLKFLDNKYLKNKPGTIAEFNYEILSEEDGYEFALGKYTAYKIKYMAGFIGNVYKGHYTGRYYYWGDLIGVNYCKNFEDAVYKLFLEITSKNNL